MQKRKTKARSIAAIAMAAVLCIAGVLAYLTATDTQTGRFSIADKPEIEVVEPSWIPENAVGLLPTQSIAKDPAVLNKSSVPSYIFADVIIPRRGLVTADAQGNIQPKDTVDVFSFAANEDWTLKATLDNYDNITYRYAYKDAISKNETTTPIFDEVTVVNYVDGEIDTASLAQQIIVTGYAVQASAFENVDDAYASFTDWEAAPEHEHAWISVDAKAATCTENGHSAYEQCIKCGEKQGYEEVIAQGHNWESVDSKAVTCTENGHSSYEQCTKCGEKQGYEEVIAQGHSWESFDAKAATCTENGHTSYEQCIKCGEKQSFEEIIAQGHSWKSVDSKAATCTENGHSSYEQCTKCGEKQGYVEIEAQGHNWVASGAITDSHVCATCGESEKHTYDSSSHECTVCSKVEPISVVINSVETTIPYGTALGSNLPVVPEKVGHTGKWVDQNGTEVTSGTVVTTPLDIVPSYTPNTYTVTYVSTDGPSVAGIDASYLSRTYGTEFALPVVQDTDEYEFDGWYTEAGLTNKVTSIPANTASNVTLYAKWIQITAFAVYSDEDKSLNFYKRAGKPSSGEEFNGRVATEVYEGIEQLKYQGGGPSHIPWSSHFNDIESLTIIDDHITPVYGTYLFACVKNITEIGNLNKLDTSKMTTMDSMFANSAGLTSLDLRTWDTSNVANMSYMFKGCSALESLNMYTWDISNVINMNSMYEGCSSLTSLYYTTWDTSNVEYMDSMFKDCSELMMDCSDWDASSVKSHVNFGKNALDIIEPNWVV